MFERCLYYNTNALARSVNKIWGEAFKQYGLSPSHAYLLRLVQAQPGISPRDICLELKLEKSTVTRFIDALTDKKLLVRRSGDDARSQSIFPTSRGAALADKLNTEGDALYKRMLATMGKDDLTQLVAMAREAERALTQDD